MLDLASISYICYGAKIGMILGRIKVTRGLDKKHHFIVIWGETRAGIWVISEFEGGEKGKGRRGKKKG